MIDLVTVITGVILALVTSFCYAIGFVLQKMGLLQGLPELHFENGFKTIIKDFLTFFENKTWVLGLFLSIVGWIPYIIAVSIVGIVVVQPIIGVGLIVSLVASHILLDEKVSLLESLSAVLLIIAPILITIAGVSNTYINLIDFLIPFLVYFLMSLIISFFFFYTSKRIKKTRIEAVFLTLTGVVLNANAIIFTNIIAQAMKDGNITLFSWFGWAEIIFGIFWFEYYHFWACISIWGIVIFYMIGFIFYQSGFQKGKASTMYLIINSLSIIIPILVGIFIFNQRFENIGMFIIAVVMIIFADINLSKYQAEIETITEIKKEKSQSSK